MTENKALTEVQAKKRKIGSLLKLGFTCTTRSKTSVPTEQKTSDSSPIPQDNRGTVTNQGSASPSGCEATAAYRAIAMDISDTACVEKKPIGDNIDSQIEQLIAEQGGLLGEKDTDRIAVDSPHNTPSPGSVRPRALVQQ